MNLPAFPFRSLVVFALLLQYSAPGVLAQTFRGAINGAVSDPSGAAVANAKVTATETATRVAHKTASTSERRVLIPGSADRAYIRGRGCAGVPADDRRERRRDRGQRLYRARSSLAWAAADHDVEVSAAAVEVDTTTSTQSDTIPTAALQDLPLNGRDFTQLIAVAPGYGGYSVGGFGSLNGTRANQMNWQIDGTDNNDFWHNIPAVNQGGVSGIAGTVMPIDAVDEFSAQTQSNAETGRSAGGTINLTHQERHQPAARQRATITTATNSMPPHRPSSRPHRNLQSLRLCATTTPDSPSAVRSSRTRPSSSLASKSSSTSSA